MDVRGKLVELLSENISEFCKLSVIRGTTKITAITLDADRFVDHLIAHDVTVQEEAKLYWKPVKPGEWNLTCSACDSHLGCKENANFCSECGAKFVYPKAVAPQPPKGE